MEKSWWWPHATCHQTSSDDTHNTHCTTGYKSVTLAVFVCVCIWLDLFMSIKIEFTTQKWFNADGNVNEWYDQRNSDTIHQFDGGLCPWPSLLLRLVLCVWLVMFWGCRGRHTHTHIYSLHNVDVLTFKYIVCISVCFHLTLCVSPMQFSVCAAH